MGQQKNIYIASIRRLFAELDTSGDGSITLNEFEDHLSEERMQAFLHTIEIDTADAWTFFKLLDADGGGSVDIDEFVEGCLRLRGNAKSIHVAQMMYENKWIMDKLMELSGHIMIQQHHGHHQRSNRHSVADSGATPGMSLHTSPMPP